MTFPRSASSGTVLGGDSSTVELVRAADAGDERAWELIVARYSGLVWGVARSYRLGESAAADVVQTTWLRLVQHLSRIRKPEALGGWLATTTHRGALAALRQVARERPTHDDHAVWATDQVEGSPEDQIVAASVGDVLWPYVDRLPQRCRTLLRMLMADPPPTYQDVSTALGMPIGSIGPTRARCLECLRRMLESSDGVDRATPGSS